MFIVVDQIKSFSNLGSIVFLEEDTTATSTPR